ncbi:MAG: hypothetical protein ACYC2Y_10480 [Armatimonadota bacterium]
MTRARKIYDKELLEEMEKVAKTIERNVPSLAADALKFRSAIQGQDRTLRSRMEELARKALSETRTPLPMPKRSAWGICC